MTLVRLGIGELCPNGTYQPVISRLPAAPPLGATTARIGQPTTADGSPYSTAARIGQEAPSDNSIPALRSR
jgi:hypothetical protein